jgi:UDP-N-acetyl-alpha-D-muramoyl-L-alanyl-L-glutamate epimerase
MSPGQKRYEQLRRQFPELIYQGYETQYKNGELFARYSFRLSGGIVFEPTFSLQPQLASDIEISDTLFRNLIFHIGMAELISYWKAACSPQIVIATHLLEPKVMDWWKRLFYHGLGEFFYTNGITPHYDDFVNFKCTGKSNVKAERFFPGDINLLPLGGGKDSAVTLEILSKNKQNVFPIFLNPTKAVRKVAAIAGYDENHCVEIKRVIDPQLLQLNEQGFLNGHTPFSALLAFYTLLPAAISGAGNIILSNESSANEPTIPGTNINHQYSKSYAFESNFREYCQNYISSDFNYFSFLRPLNELQIAALFSGYEKYHDAFRSCNAGSKTGIWCGKCPKCLFTFIILSPFLEPKALTGIFGHNLFEDAGQAHHLEQLCGLHPEKPFDCIGTIDEVNAAIHAAIQKYSTNELPILLQRYKQSLNYEPAKKAKAGKMLYFFDKAHFLPESFLNILITSINNKFLKM